MAAFFIKAAIIQARLDWVCGACFQPEAVVA
jgi:hypothetical protein